ncbi:MAG: GTP cyclohydrolase I, partial [Myxococcota bacterium]|nr:GTP cyclohydrolase I [Myxococcota bacterium]
MKRHESSDPIEAMVASMIEALGEDPRREGLKKTPARVARSMRFLTAGYEADPIQILNNAPFTFLKRIFSEGFLLFDRD